MKAERALRAAVRAHASAATKKAKKSRVKKARKQVRNAYRAATILEDRGALRVTVVTGRTKPYQGWVSAGSETALLLGLAYGDRGLLVTDEAGQPMRPRRTATVFAGSAQRLAFR